MVNFTPIPALRDNYIWLLQQGSICAVIDPGDACPVIAYLKKHDLTLSAILITHHHWDHTNGIDDLLTYANVPVYGPHNPAIAQVTHPLAKGDTLQLENIIGNIHIETIPGHTLDHIAYIHDTFALTGDTLFSAGCGRVFEGTMTQMVASLTTLAALPNHTKMYCGHEYTLDNLHFAQAVEPDNKKIQATLAQVQQWRNNKQPSLPSTIGLEKAINPFLRCEEPAVIAAATTQAQHPQPDAITVFKTLREWKNNFPSHETTKIENTPPKPVY